MVGLNWTVIIMMTIFCFGLGAIWHGPLFGKLWMRIHHGKDSFHEKEMKEATKGIWKLLVTEFIATLLIICSPDHSRCHRR